ncbi:MAG TPA: UDP-3-O-(3-hydroxymyristoyl)glucosamine N-acyltransferase [Sulfurivirga caldicuralii]|nr:UDP-3-O-(3-hydroxymyristoyl)glucosamine N-acyltransferase [Sulfurivirga caldicuralii]
MPIRLDQLCQTLEEEGVSVLSCPDQAIELSSVATLSSAQPDQLSFLANERYMAQLKTTRAGAVLVTAQHADQVPSGTLAIVVDDPYFAYAIAAAVLHPAPVFEPGIHPTARIHATAQVDEQAAIGPFVWVGEGAVIEAGVQIMSHCHIGAEVHLHEGVRLEPGVVLYPGTQVGAKTRIKAGAVIGSDGFGFAPRQGRWQAVPQLGRVIIGERCSIGANTTIDCGAIEDTIIGNDVIIDNLVQIGHNVQVGDGTAMASQVGVSGSVKIGQHCILAGQVGTAGHLHIADGAHIMARGGVTSDVEAAGDYAGFPLMPRKAWQKMVVYERNLPKMHQTIKQLQQALKAIEQELDQLKGTEIHDERH